VSKLFWKESVVDFEVFISPFRTVEIIKNPVMELVNAMKWE
jgi:hypothetical protein